MSKKEEKKCDRHFWVIKPFVSTGELFPKEGRIICYCPKCDLEVSTPWSEFFIIRDSEHNSAVINENRTYDYCI